MFEITQALLTQNPRYIHPLKKNKTCYMQHSTGTPGVNAQKFVQAWNSRVATAETEFIIDDTGIYQLLPIGIKSWHCGGSGNNTHVGCEICEPEATRLLDVNWVNLKKGNSGNPTYSVKLLQQALRQLKLYDGNIDGVFGEQTAKAVQQYQSEHKLTQDGVVGLDTLHSLQSEKKSPLLYNAEENQAYFEDVYRKAIYTCAYVLNKVGQKTIDNNSVLCHCEGYKKGIASNHSDVLHWFPKHGKTMDDFRADVKTYIDTGILPYSGKEQNQDTAWGTAQKLGLFREQKQSDVITAGDLVAVLNTLNLLK